jgi:hypothetical protein
LTAINLEIFLLNYSFINMLNVLSLNLMPLGVRRLNEYQVK